MRLLMTIILSLVPLADMERKPAMPPALKAEAESDLSGIYLCSGTNPAGKPYEGVVVILREDAPGTGHFVQWVVGTEYVSGAGMLKDKTLSVGWSQGPIRGVTVYQFDGTTAKGRYQTIPGSGKSHPEGLKLLRRFSKDA